LRRAQVGLLDERQSGGNEQGLEPCECRVSLDFERALRTLVKRAPPPIYDVEGHHAGEHDLPDEVPLQLLWVIEPVLKADDHRFVAQHARQRLSSGIRIGRLDGDEHQRGIRGRLGCGRKAQSVR
jgi:hypothetical protein